MIKLHCGDCLNVMPWLDANSVDAIVTDPPYGLSFMGKEWDHGAPGERFWAEALRVAKPGAHLLAFGGTRTFHRLAVAIEDAGWEIRDTVMWVYGSGFPKSHDVSKAIDREAGAERETVRVATPSGNAERRGEGEQGATYGDEWGGFMALSRPATPLAEQWQGWGTALKPAWEPIIVARKPLVGTVAQNVTTWGTGAINVDACRVGHNEPCPSATRTAPRYSGRTMANGERGGEQSSVGGPAPQGRWPANVIHDGSDEVTALMPVTTSGKMLPETRRSSRSMYGQGNGRPTDRETPGDTGSAARFFYCAKASKRDRDEGCEGLEERVAGAMAGNQTTVACRPAGDGVTPVQQVRARNNHPTVKPTALMRYLCRLVTQPGGVVLDPFMGSGSTGKAAVLEGFNFIGIEMDADYLEIARRRIEHAEAQANEPAQLQLEAR